MNSPREPSRSSGKGAGAIMGTVVRMAGSKNAAQGFRFSLDDAQAMFPGVPPRRMVLAVVATVRPGRDWNGCQVFLKFPCADDDGSADVHVGGDAAHAVVERLVATLGNLGVPVREQTTGGPSRAAELLTSARDGRWV